MVLKEDTTVSIHILSQMNPVYSELILSKIPFNGIFFQRLSFFPWSIPITMLYRVLLATGFLPILHDLLTTTMLREECSYVVSHYSVCYLISQRLKQLSEVLNFQTVSICTLLMEWAANFHSFGRTGKIIVLHILIVRLYILVTTQRGLNWRVESTFDLNFFLIWICILPNCWNFPSAFGEKNS
jgi:hypothetical protein